MEMWQTAKLSDVSGEEERTDTTPYALKFAELLSRFFTDFNSDNGTSTQTESPANLTIGADNTIDLVNLFLDLGGSRIGGDLSS